MRLALPILFLLSASSSLLLLLIIIIQSEDKSSYFGDNVSSDGASHEECLGKKKLSHLFSNEPYRAKNSKLIN
jgi:hypothetical protein